MTDPAAESQTDRIVRLAPCPKCGRGEMKPHYVAPKAGQCSDPRCWLEHRYDCQPAQSRDRDGDCPESEHLHERCTTCRYERVAECAATR